MFPTRVVAPFIIRCASAEAVALCSTRDELAAVVLLDLIDDEKANLADTSWLAFFERRRLAQRIGFLEAQLHELSPEDQQHGIEAWAAARVSVDTGAAA